MTAGAGILHEEFHSEAFTRIGGTLEMVQLWVNLPARDKMTAPGYQAIRHGDIPVATLPGDAGTVRVIAGQYGNHVGPARTFTPMHVWDLRLAHGNQADLPLPEGWNAAIVVLRGGVRINGEATASSAQMAVLARERESVTLEAFADATVLLLAGEPIDEPVAAYGPFVMNTEQEIRQALADSQSGRFVPATA